MQTNLSELKNNIDLASIVENAGVELQKSGTRYKGRCPLHADRTPSFFVFPDNRFKCFGCGEHGDVIDFVQKMHGLSFPDALKYLGIEQGNITPEVKRDIERRKLRKKRVKEFRDWVNRYTAHVGSLIIETEKLMKSISPEDLDLYAPLLHGLPVWEYHLDILINGNDKLKFELYKDVERGQNGGRKF